MGASRVSRTLFSTFILTDLTGSSSRPKNPSKTCAPQGPPQYSCGSIFFYICSIASHRTLLLSLSMNLQQLKKLCCWMEWQRKQKENR